MNIKCDNCTHYKVCLQREKYFEILNDIAKSISQINFDDLGFSVTIDCNFFEPKKEYLHYINCLNSNTNLRETNKQIQEVKCKDCEYIEFELPYAVCGEAYKGIVTPDDSCGKGKAKGKRYELGLNNGK